MRKILISLSASMLLLLGSVSAFADGFGVGVTISQAKIKAAGTETETGSQTAETTDGSADNSVTIGSVFAEYNWGLLTFGVDYIPVSSDVSDATHTRSDTETSVTGTTTATTTARTQTAAAEVSDHTTAYIELGNTAYVKAGYVQMNVQTKESLDTGSSYGDATLNGTLLGAGLKSDWGNNGFIKIEGTVTDYDSLSLVSTVARTGVTTNNKITADLDVSRLTLGVGYRF